MTKVETVEEARTLARGTIVGDRCGGVSFSEAVAAALESRSTAGWQEIEPEPGATPWTIIILER